MSKVQLQGNVSGTGIFTIASPNSNTDRTLTLPDNTGTVLTSASTLSPSQLGSQFSVNSGAPSSSFVMDSVGRVFTPYQVAFSAILTGTPTATANAIIPCNTESFDIGGNYNTSTYTFTAPVAGRYFFGWTVRYNGYQASVYLHPRLNVNGGSLAISHQIVSIGTSAGAAYISMSWAGVVSLSANDAVTLYDASETGKTLGQYQADQTGFSGYLLG